MKLSAHTTQLLYVDGVNGGLACRLTQDFSRSFMKEARSVMWTPRQGETKAPPTGLYVL
jgi:hypothetical protein